MIVYEYWNTKNLWYIPGEVSPHYVYGELMGKYEAFCHKLTRHKRRKYGYAYKGKAEFTWAQALKLATSS